MDMKGKLPPRAPMSTRNESTMAAPIVPKGTQADHHVTYSDNNTQPIPGSVLDKILADSKKKAKQESDKAKAPKTNWISKL